MYPANQTGNKIKSRATVQNCGTAFNFLKQVFYVSLTANGNALAFGRLLHVIGSQTAE